MPHFITERCTGCTICEIKCPTTAISGEKKRLYYIDPKLCIDCRVCGVWCPYDAIVDVIGRNGDSSWVQVNFNGTSGWAAGWVGTISGDINALPVTG